VYANLLPKRKAPTILRAEGRPLLGKKVRRKKKEEKVETSLLEKGASICKRGGKNRKRDIYEVEGESISIPMKKKEKKGAKGERRDKEVTDFNW